MTDLDFSSDSILDKYFCNCKKPSVSRFTELFQTLTTEENQKEKNIFSSTIDNDKKSKNEEKLEIIPYKIKKGQDKRSTIIIKGIPSFLTANEVYILVNQFYNKINFFYIPSYIQNQKEYMYAFVNVNNYKGIINIYNGFMKLKQQYTNCFGSIFSKVELFYSKTQGKSALINKYMNEKDDLTIGNIQNFF